MWQYRKRICLVACLVLLGWCQATAAKKQDISITEFERRVTDLTASVRPAYDYAGEACAVIRFSVRDTTFIVEGNLGVVKRESSVGQILLWVPKGTKRLTVRHEGLLTLAGYEIPVEIESKGAYHAVLLATREPSVGNIEPPIVPEPQKPTPPKEERQTETDLFVGAGFNVLPTMGPSVTFGADINHHVIEIGGTYGLKKSDALYYYSKGALVGSYKYRSMRASISYGYDIKPTPVLGIMPKAGVAMNYISSSTEDSKADTGGIRKVTTASAFGALRLTLCLGEKLKLHVTPEYDVAVHQTDNGKILSENCSTIKKWSEGLGLNVGLIVNL